MSITRSQKARKTHRCDGCDRPGKIKPGDRYLTHTALRGDDIGYSEYGYPNQPKIPQRSKECAECATRYGRAELLAAHHAEAAPTGAASSIKGDA